METFIKLYRKTLENPIVFKDADHIAVWVWLLLKVRAFPKEVTIGNKVITLQPGQYTTGRKAIADDLKISESKVQRVLKTFENEHMIEQQMFSKCRLISICSWDKYQNSEQDNGQQLNSKRTASEQQVNTNRERREREKENNDYYSSLLADEHQRFVEFRKARGLPVVEEG